jgi:hypothetical protein
MQEYAKALRNIYNKERLWRQSGYRYRNLLSEAEVRLIGPAEQEKFGPLMSNYYVNSKAMQSYRRLATSNSYRFWGILLAMILTLIGVYYVDFNLPYDREIALKSVTTLVPVLFVIGYSLFSVAQRERAAPLGLTPMDAIGLSLLGPFVADIRDFDPNDARVPAGRDLTLP